MNKNNKILFTLGRILFALPFGLIGLNHFLMVDYYTGMLTSFIPGGGFTILLTGFFLIAASVSIIARKFITISCILLAAMLLIFILTIHIPQLSDPELSKAALMQLLKDAGLMGGALMVAAIYKDENKEKE